METELKPHRGVAILVLGILSLMVCVICGIFAWLWANEDLQLMDQGLMDPEGRGLTQAGKICAIISVILNVTGLVLGFLWMLFFFVFVGFAASSG